MVGSALFSPIPTRLEASKRIAGTVLTPRHPEDQPQKRDFRMKPRTKAFLAENRNKQCCKPKIEMQPPTDAQQSWWPIDQTSGSTLSRFRFALPTSIPANPRSHPRPGILTAAPTSVTLAAESGPSLPGLSL